MQAQARPPAPQDKYTPPAAPHVPITAVQSLIPRLATAINDIDGLKAQLAAGNVDGTMPSWDVLLQRYAMLLGRVQALSTYISQPPRPTGPAVRPRPGASLPGQAAAPVPGAPAGASGPSRPGAPAPPGDAPAAAQPPALAHYLVHPLRALPADAGPLAGDTFFQAINTQPLPAVQAAHAALLGDGDESGSGSGAGTGAGAGSGAGAGAARAPGPGPSHTLEALSHLDDGALARLTTELRTRLAREAHRAQAMGREIARREDEYDWTLRLGDEDEDDLFGGHDDDDDVVMVDDDEKEKDKQAKARQGWSVADYLRLMDTGRTPPAPAAGAA